MDFLRVKKQVLTPLEQVTDITGDAVHQINKNSRTSSMQDVRLLENHYELSIGSIGKKMANKVPWPGTLDTDT